MGYISLDVFGTFNFHSLQEKGILLSLATHGDLEVATARAYNANRAWKLATVIYCVCVGQPYLTPRSSMEISH